MSRRIAVVGAGQAGCQLALGLRRNGYEVTLLNDRSAEEIRRGRVMSAQCMFETAIEAERAMELSFWDQTCPLITSVSMRLSHTTSDPEVEWEAALDAPAQSVDQRLKLPRWIDEFVELGGTFRVCRVTPDDLEDLAREHDLVVVATGQGALNSIFASNHDVVL